MSCSWVPPPLIITENISGTYFLSLAATITQQNIEDVAYRCWNVCFCEQISHFCICSLFQMLRQELQQFVSSVSQLDEASQSVLSDVNADHRQLIVQNVANLLSRLQTVEDDATKNEKALNKRRQDLTAYQVCIWDFINLQLLHCFWCCPHGRLCANMIHTTIILSVDPLHLYSL